MDHTFPEKLQFLFEPHRYKVIYGGRGAAKSWGVARALLILGAMSTKRILCVREIQNSIKDSVHKLLKDQIDAMGMSHLYEIQNNTIKGTENKTEFIFEGLRHNSSAIKSMEGIDIVWAEEAQMVSSSSWKDLTPTIRKDGSEIWITFNPELDTDETYRRFVLSPPPDACVVKINWQDNPWFPEVLRKEKDHLRDTDYDSYLNVWEGYCRQTLDGAIFADEIRKATTENRITKVPYDPLKPVHTFWDLGWSDLTSIWFAQSVGFDYRIINFHQNRHRTIEQYLQVLQNKGYVYGYDHLPHDAESGTLASNGRGVDQMMRAAGRKIKIIPRMAKKAIGINAARTIFSHCYFDEENTADGLQSLRHYRYTIDSSGQLSREPLHNEHSHAADAFIQLALSIRGDTRSDSDRTTKITTPHRPVFHKPQSGSWMI